MHEAEWDCFADRPMPGGVLAAVAVQGESPDWRTWGESGSGGSSLSLDSPFYAGSLAKQFTAASVASLVLDGRLSLRTRICEVVPGLPRTFAGIRVEHLLSHTAGLPDANTLDRRIGFDASSSLSNADRLSALWDAVPEAAPGQVHRYNNYGYVLLAEAVRHETSKSLGAFVREALLEPAGMATSGFVDSAHPEPVPGWSRGGRVTVRFSSVGDGGLITTAADLLRWSDWLPRSRVAHLMLGPRPVLPDGSVAHDAWGISIRPHHGLRIESHGGAFDGYLCSMVRIPEQRVTFLAMTNNDVSGPARLSDQLRCLADSVLHDVLDLRLPAWNASHGMSVD